MAGADRIEGTLFGNGERTGNVDIVTLAMNLFTQGVDPATRHLRHRPDHATAEYCNQLPVHPRHPMPATWCSRPSPARTRTPSRRAWRRARANRRAALWEVPYLPIDPADVGRSYEAVIRVNSAVWLA